MATFLSGTLRLELLRGTIMTSTLVLSLAAPLLTGVIALLWAGFVARGISDAAEVQTAPDLRTW